MDKRKELDLQKKATQIRKYIIEEVFSAKIRTSGRLPVVHGYFNCVIFRRNESRSQEP